MTAGKILSSAEIIEGQIRSCKTEPATAIGRLSHSYSEQTAGRWCGNLGPPMDRSHTAIPCSQLLTASWLKVEPYKNY